MIKIHEDDFTEYRYPNFSLNRVCFKNVFNGDLLNIYTTIEPTNDFDKVKSDVLAMVENLKIYLHSKNLNKSPNDKIQIIIGWDQSIKKENRQIYKVSLDVLNFQLSGGKFIQGWDIGIHI